MPHHSATCDKRSNAAFLLTLLFQRTIPTTSRDALFSMGEVRSRNRHSYWATPLEAHCVHEG
jgi:hypothetical protein